MLSTRLVFGFSMVGALLLVLCLDEWFAPWFPVWFVLALIVMGTASLELVALLSNTTIKPSGNTVFAGIMTLVFANWAPHVTSHFLATSAHGDLLGSYDPLGPVNDLGWPLMAFVGVVMGAFVVQSLQRHKPGDTVARIAGSTFAVAYLGLLGSFMIQLRWFHGPYHGILPLAFLVATSKGADTGAYTVGRIAGRHKLWPRISPNKTIEGAIGGLLFGVGAALITAAVARYLLHVPTLGWAVAVGFGVIVSSAAQFGDLMESMIKRECARKDASAAVPGFGGVLDVIDSLLFAAPVAFAYWLAFGP
ncbi:phosphatidate cytidylyltransferase [Singulisphaera sp. GP187]|uniref:phosphatidate cytidylyltransferase n=1 Tax=Singulisphaera sp. GP187 TaxID=1882752 RepID=UPI000928510B|nr:phosphatidate cytidylyltransferase [Singulisphaera sp. GP187]SIO20216.1 phosphatidate cytidylyltransferase [Singulisphaera sp. GP187]